MISKVSSNPNHPVILLCLFPVGGEEGKRCFEVWIFACLPAAKMRNWIVLSALEKPVPKSVLLRQRSWKLS